VIGSYTINYHDREGEKPAIWMCKPNPPGPPASGDGWWPLNKEAALDILQFGYPVSRSATPISGVTKYPSLVIPGKMPLCLADAILQETRQIAKTYDIDTAAVMLSGGLDSTTIAAAATHIFNEVHTYTLRFPSRLAVDEGPRAQAAAQALGTKHHEIHFDIHAAIQNVEEISAATPQWTCYAYDQVIRAAKRDGHKLLLSGEGGDEHWVGYIQRYRHAARAAKTRVFAPLAKHFKWLPGRAGRIASCVARSTDFNNFMSWWNSRIRTWNRRREFLPLNPDDWVSGVIAEWSTARLEWYLGNLYSLARWHGIILETPLMHPPCSRFRVTTGWRAEYGKKTLRAALKAIVRQLPGGDDAYNIATMGKHGFSGPAPEAWWNAGIRRLFQEHVPNRPEWPRAIRRLLEKGTHPGRNRNMIYAAARDITQVYMFTEKQGWI